MYVSRATGSNFAAVQETGGRAKNNRLHDPFIHRLEPVKGGTWQAIKVQRGRSLSSPPPLALGGIEFYTVDTTYTTRQMHGAYMYVGVSLSLSLSEEWEGVGQRVLAAHDSQAHMYC